jgi:hypothetical protein
MKDVPCFRSYNKIDYNISLVVGLETYKALYVNWPSLYSYISYPLVPTNYYNSLVLGVISSSGLNYDESGFKIKNVLTDYIKDIPISENDKALINPLLNSSYPIKNLNSTPWEIFIWISISIFLITFILFYFYYVGGVSYIFGNDGISCYNCPSIFDKF